MPNKELTEEIKLMYNRVATEQGLEKRHLNNDEAERITSLIEREIRAALANNELK